MEEGLSGVEIARRVGFSQSHISTVRRRFWEGGLQHVAGMRNGRSEHSAKPRASLPKMQRERIVRLTEREHAAVREVCSDVDAPRFLRRRAQALLLLHQELSNGEVARRTGYVPEYISSLRRLFAKDRLGILGRGHMRLGAF